MGKWSAAAVATVVAIGMMWIVAGRSGEVGGSGPDATSAASGQAVAEGAPLVEVTLPSALPPDAEIGERLFDQACVACDDTYGAGRDRMGPPLVHRAYEPFRHGDASFLTAVRNGAREQDWSFGDMPPLEERLTDAEVGYLVRYVRELQAANGIQ